MLIQVRSFNFKTFNCLTLIQIRFFLCLQEEYDVEQLQERERAVRQLESDILDVNTIFKVLSHIARD